MGANAREAKMLGLVIVGSDAKFEYCCSRRYFGESLRGSFRSVFQVAVEVPERSYRTIGRWSAARIPRFNSIKRHIQNSCGLLL